jgi:hypothetical protein
MAQWVFLGGCTMNVVVLLDPFADKELSRELPEESIKEADTAALELAHSLKSNGQAKNIWAISITETSTDTRRALVFC